jgi:hypothetical protein
MMNECRRKWTFFEAPAGKLPASLILTDQLAKQCRNTLPPARPCYQSNAIGNREKNMTIRTLLSCRFPITSYTQLSRSSNCDWIDGCPHARARDSAAATTTQNRSCVRAVNRCAREPRKPSLGHPSRCIERPMDPTRTGLMADFEPERFSIAPGGFGLL